MNKPNSQKTFVLFKLIKNKRGISERDTVFNMFRGTISTLRKELGEIGVTLKHIEKPFINQFGRKRKYRVHWLLNSEKPKALKLYKQLTSKAAQAIGEE